MGAECLSYMKSIETHARAFSRLISDGISGVQVLTLAGTDLLCMLNWGTQWTMVSYLKK